jgi:hypothetical protein
MHYTDEAIKGFAGLGVLKLMEEFLERRGYKRLFAERIAPQAGQARFSSVGDRRVLGSMNDLVKCMSYVMARGETDLDTVAVEHNGMPAWDAGDEVSVQGVCGAGERVGEG